MPRKKKKLNTSKSKLLWLILLICAVVIPLAIFSYNKFLDYKDEQKFKDLKQQFLSLQQEFNKVDEGWKYSEGCKDNGEEFFNNVSSCYLLLTNKSDEHLIGQDFIDSYKKIILNRGFAGNVRSSSTSKNEDGGDTYYYLSFIKKGLFHEIWCDLVLTVYSDKDNTSTATFECHSDARSWHFKET